MRLIGRERVSVRDIAEALHPGAARYPTAEQEAVITADAEPMLVVAGAGSGKTETMSMRVLWLLANEFAEPDDILGLTFTTKAASELRTRLHSRVQQLVSAGLIAPERTLLAQPAVSTYNAYANQIYREHALVIGRDPDADVVQTAAAWVLARDIVRASTDERLAAIGSVEQVTDAVMTLAGQLGDDALHPGALRGFAEQFARTLHLPLDAPGDRPTQSRSVATVERTVEEAVAGVQALDPLLDLAQQFDERKRALGVVQYSDQVRFALEILQVAPTIAAEHRSRATFVLLDEYQDTSSVQVRLLATLFRDRCVMAVGDPHQSIYGWRGASAGTLQRFHTDFGGTAKASLSISWRNDHRILDVANGIAAELPAGGVQSLRARDGAGPGQVEIVQYGTEWDEAAAIATWLLDRRAKHPDMTAAVLVRSRSSTLPALTHAFDSAGVPYRVVGTGGLLGEPEVVDLCCALRVVTDRNAGNDLIRLLAGSRWRIGVRDLAALGAHASTLRRFESGSGSSPAASLGVDAHVSIVDALDDLADRPLDSKFWEPFSSAATTRLIDAARTFRMLRSQTSMSLPEFARFVERTLRIDIESAAHPVRHRRRVLDAFAHEVESFAATDAQGSLESFLAWLVFAERHDELSTVQESPEPGVVQILTIHAAKGLEWDVVAVPGMAKQSFPGSPKSTRGWLARGNVPFEFRGDAEALPTIDWRGAESKAQLRRELDEFSSSMSARFHEEERRLAYVAVTRAVRELRLSSSVFGGSRIRAYEPGVFMTDAAAALGRDITDVDLVDENPGSPFATSLQWPRDPLGARRERVEAAAAAVRASDATPSESLATTIDLLLAERSPTRHNILAPERVSASHFKDWVHDPAAAAQQSFRPMPQRPYRATRLGTLFHQWVETRHSVQSLPDAVDDVPIDDEELVGVDAEKLELLRATFLASEFADRSPIATELEVHMPLAGATVVCKMDAVYLDAGRYTVVDWKTGALPRSKADYAERQLQLALYRIAFAKHAGIEPDQVDAALYFVEHDTVLRPERLMSEAELALAWDRVRDAVSSR